MFLCSSGSCQTKLFGTGLHLPWQWCIAECGRMIRRVTWDFPHTHRDRHAFMSSILVHTDTHTNPCTQLPQGLGNCVCQASVGMLQLSINIDNLTERVKKWGVEAHELLSVSVRANAVQRTDSHVVINCVGLEEVTAMTSSFSLHLQPVWNIEENFSLQVLKNAAALRSSKSDKRKEERRKTV